MTPSAKDLALFVVSQTGASSAIVITLDEEGMQCAAAIDSSDERFVSFYNNIVQLHRDMDEAYKMRRETKTAMDKMAEELDALLYPSKN